MSDHIEDKNEDVINMVQVLEEEQLLQEDANAVLGASDSVQCTYSKGYIQRQALYACRSCRLQDLELAGVCLACALECHDGHDLVELYTKRNFRCDCGNAKFVEGTKSCKLCPEKSLKNTENRYNQNFSGLYCKCARPYPDPEDSVDDLMLQCSICEDWYHSRHLGREEDAVPEQETFEEVTCESCVDRCSFLRMYARVCSGSSAVCQDTSENVDVEGCTSQNGDSVNMGPSSSTAEQADTLSGSSNIAECRFKLLSSQDSSEACASSGGIFWQSGWRRKLCKCKDCLATYDNLGVSFLTDEDDTIAAYEERGKLISTKSSYDKGLEALQSMNRVQQVELVHGFDELKTELKDYLKKFADNGKVVREEDISEFFRHMEAKKRQRTTDQMQYFCK